MTTESDIGAQESPAPATTPASIKVALFFFGFAIATPFFGYLAASNAGHDGFKILGLMLLWLAAGGLASIIGIICTVIGMRHEPYSNWTGLSCFLSVCAGAVLLFFLARAM